MNENTKKKIIPLLAVGLLLLAWALCATGMAVRFNGQYRDLQSDISNAGNDELVKRIKQQENTITFLLDNNSELRTDLESALEFSGELRDRNRRAIEIVVGSSERFVEFEETVDSGGDLIENIISRQQRITFLVNGLREDNRRLRDTFNLRP